MSGSLSTLSDEQLKALYQGAPPAAAAPQAPASSLAGMSDDQLRSMYSEPTNPPVAGRRSDVATGNLATDIPRFIGTAAATAGAGAMALPRLAAQGVDWLGSKAGLDLGADKKLASIHNPGNPDYSAFPDYHTARDLMLGGMDATEYVPTTYAGRRAMDATSGVMGGLLGGSASVIPNALMGVGSGAGAELFPNHPLAAALAFGGLGQKVGQLAQNAPQRLATAMVGGGTMNEPYGAFVRQGLPTELAGTTTGDKGLLAAEKMGSRMSGSEVPFGAARDRLYSAWQNRLGQVADKLGTAATPQEAGVSLQSAARNWLTDFKANTGTLWNDFYSKVPQGTPVTVSNYDGALKNVLGDFAGAPATGKILQPGTVKSLSDALGVDLQAGGGTLPWDAVKNVRTAIGEKLANPQTIADTSQASLKQLYAGLTRDMEAGAGGVSPEALTAFHKANAATAAGHQLLEDHLNGVLTAATPEQATQYAMAQARTGGSRVGAVTFNLPGAAGDLGSYALRNAATNTESPSALANALAGRRPIYSPEAQQVLFPNARTKADIADLTTAGRSMQPLEKDLANSPTATHMARGPGRIIAAVELARQGHELAGVPGAIAGAGAGLFAPQIVGRVAQATALNPYLSALYGHAIPVEAGPPSLLARALIAQGVGQSRLPMDAPPYQLAPATSPNSSIR